MSCSTSRAHCTRRSAWPSTPAAASAVRVARPRPADGSVCVGALPPVFCCGCVRCNAQATHSTRKHQRARGLQVPTTACCRPRLQSTWAASARRSMPPRWPMRAPSARSIRPALRARWRRSMSCLRSGSSPSASSAAAPEVNTEFTRIAQRSAPRALPRRCGDPQPCSGRVSSRTHTRTRSRALPRSPRPRPLALRARDRRFSSGGTRGRVDAAGLHRSRRGCAVVRVLCPRFN